MICLQRRGALRGLTLHTAVAWHLPNPTRNPRNPNPWRDAPAWTCEHRLCLSLCGQGVQFKPKNTSSQLKLKVGNSLEAGVLASRLKLNFTTHEPLFGSLTSCFIRGPPLQSSKYETCQVQCCPHSSSIAHSATRARVTVISRPPLAPHTIHCECSRARRRPP